MRAIIVMFDTLRRDYLPNYGNMWVHAQNFQRLGKKCTTFDNFYAGSLPCIPARRELHTGKYNFLFRGWGPLEPFDFSVFEVLKENGVYTHLVTDHSHYFEDGGATYHNRYNTWEGFRGQEGDRWVPQDLALLPENLHPLNKHGISVIQHYANRTRQRTEEEMSSVRTVAAGLEFMKTHADKDHFLLQIECFDPHEPFYAPQKYRDLYKCTDYGGKFDWPAYQSIDAEQNKSEIEKVRKEYAALISMCDAQLGKILDMMDELDMWRDTLLIVTTDHGFLLGEHNFIGKNFMPAYEELVHLPFFIHDPRCECGERRCSALAQTIDIAPTLLDFFGVDLPDNMEGKPLFPLLKGDVTNHKTILFGIYGGHVNIFDGEYVYMRACANEKNEPLFSYTLMPTNMRGFFPSQSLEKIEIVKGMRLTNGIPCLRIPVQSNIVKPQMFGNLLFHIPTDPFQKKNIINPEIECRMVHELVQALNNIEAPAEVFERLGLSAQ
ncbi:sulfatase [Thermoanaerobacterium thermosaccharolyticum]|uniref:Sulfatase n=1 Tax=Thermoanaerobacterium thermosaccharolyticum TaxID=1517 RepID=A0A223HXB3_THETR|nr:sulfatase [Thermoanaerobacterium thermosaccharolyticum]AST57108.1 sulfatase [Thermoanaerobacterium thermosaccharolyticum]